MRSVNKQVLNLSHTRVNAPRQQLRQCDKWIEWNTIYWLSGRAKPTTKKCGEWNGYNGIQSIDWEKCVDKPRCMKWVSELCGARKKHAMRKKVCITVCVTLLIAKLEWKPFYFFALMWENRTRSIASHHDNHNSFTTGHNNISSNRSIKITTKVFL